MIKSKNKKIIALLVVMALISTASMIFTYWNTAYDKSTDTLAPGGTVKIGTGSNTTTTLTVTSDDFGTDDDSLVPDTVTPIDNQTKSISFATTVTWQSSGGGSVNGATGTLNVVLTSVKDGNKELIDEDLFDIDFDPGEVTGGTSGTPVTVTITMDEPDDLRQYNLVADKDLTFTFEFSIVAKSTT